MSFSENVLAEISNIAKENEISFFDAAVEFCEQNDMEASELIESLDKTAVEIIRMEALSGNALRKKYRPKQENKIMFD